MTALDWVLLLIVGASALFGLLRGLIGIAMSLAAWLLAGLAAYLFGGEVGRSLVTDGQLGWGEYLGGYALSFFAVWIAVALVGLVVRRIAHSAGLSEVDRVFGFGLGLVRGVFLACVLLLMLGVTSIPGTAAWRESNGVTLLLPGAKWMRGWMPEWMRQRVDLEGRGNSLQERMQVDTAVLKQALPMALPEPLPEVLPAALPVIAPQGFPRSPPQTAPRDPKLVTPDPPSDDARVH